MRRGGHGVSARAWRLADPARRGAASRPAGRHAVDRHSRHLAVASRHRSPPLGAAVAAQALGITVAPSTVWQILKDAGDRPGARRDGPGWAEFLRSQAQGKVDCWAVSGEALHDLIDRSRRRRDAARVIWIAQQPSKLADGGQRFDAS
jgi:hypothetical protein